MSKILLFAVCYKDSGEPFEFSTDLEELQANYGEDYTYKSVNVKFKKADLENIY